MKIEVQIRIEDQIKKKEIIDLYRANQWSSAKKAGLLIPALENSHTLVTARISGRLVGLANAISDGFLVVYYPHMLVHPDFHGRGIGTLMMECLAKKYDGFHQQVLLADKDAVGFYETRGFTRAGSTEPMWIYHGDDH